MDSENKVPTGSTSLLRSNSKTAPKKMIIKPFKVQPKPPAAFEEETIHKLHSAIHAIHQKQHTLHSQEDLYRSVESLCIHKKEQVLYDLLYQSCDKHINASIHSLSNRTSDLVLFLGMVEELWNDHCNQMLTIRSVFLFLDRTYVIQNALQSSQPRSLWDLGLQLYAKHLLANSEVLQKIVSGLLEQIERDRKGENIKRSLVKSLSRMFTSLKLYQSHFEKDFLTSSQSFYAAESSRMLQEMNIPDYLVHVSNRLAQENDRISTCLDVMTRRALLATVEDTLIKIHVNDIIHHATGFDSLMNDDRRADLTRMYSLLSKVHALDDLKSAFFQYIKTVGTSFVSVPERDKRMIEDLLSFKDKLDQIFVQCFSSHSDFAAALKSAFEQFINSRENTPAELIARFVDARLRAGNKGMTNEELDQLLDKLLVLFRYVHGKDVFQNFYKKLLAKRLLVGKSASKDTELSMIAKLKAECGQSFTKKLEGMFRDMELSSDIMTQFSQFVKNGPTKPEVDLTVQVLTTGHWPEYVPQDIKLPRQVALSLDLFKTFYLNKHNGRKLTWQHTLATCVLKAHFSQRKHELAVSGHQATVLMLFNEAEQLSMQQIKELTGFDETELSYTLQSLAHDPKVRILLQEPKNKKIENSNVFSVNTQFKHQLFRIKVSTIQMKETKAEQKQTIERVFADRQYAIDATIVRIMKARKSLSHSQLMAEILQQLKFPSTPSDIKKRIASLIEREYLERDEKDSKVYRYLA